MTLQKMSWEFLYFLKFHNFVFLEPFQLPCQHDADLLPIIMADGEALAASQRGGWPRAVTAGSVRLSACSQERALAAEGGAAGSVWEVPSV